MDTLLQDLRYAVRMLRKKAAFTVVAAIALALGIGANTAIFSVVNAVLLKPLPFPEPERLMMVWMDNRRQGMPEDITSYPNYKDWREQNQVFEELAAYSGWTVNLTGTGEPQELRGARVVASFFQVTGVAPQLGRPFTVEEETQGRDQVAILSHGLWQRRFGGDPGIVGQTIQINGETRQVVGVMPPGFDFPGKAEIWGPLAPADQLRQSRNAYWLPVVGRLKAGVSREQAQTEMSAIAARLEAEYPSNVGLGINIVPLHEQVVGQIRPALLVLLGSVAFVLLIACANVANLLLARAAERQKEMAVRAALGAGRGRIIRQLVTESVLLALLGGSLGLLLAYWGVELLVRLGPSNIPRLDQVQVDGRVLAFTLGLSLLTGLVFGLAPALQASRTDLNDSLKEGGRGGTAGRAGQRLRKALVVAEVGLALVLLVGAGLLIRSFWKLQQVDPGFSPDGLITARLSLPRSKYPEGTQVASFYKELLERLRALPGVERVGATTSIMLSRLPNSANFSIEGRPVEPLTSSQELPLDAVTPDYFQTMGIPLIRGRAFDERDTADAPPVAIINETMARRYWPDEDPINKRFKFSQPDSQDPWITIVGVVRDTRRQGLDAPIRIESFHPEAQMQSRSMTIVARTTGDPMRLASALRETVWSMDRDLPVPKIETADQILSETLAERRLSLLLLAIFASVALVLAGVGIYGVMSYAVNQRTHEIGIRMALGAARGDVLRLIVGHGMGLVALGVLLGLGGAFALTRLMESLLFGVGATDPLTFALIALLLVLVALLACTIPARRATRVDPMVALRYE